MRPSRFAAIIAVLNTIVLFFLIVVTFGLTSSTFPVQFTDSNGNRFLGRGISDFALNGILGLVLLVIVLAFVELVLLVRLWRKLREAQGLPPPRPLERAAGFLARRTPRSLRIIAFGILVISLFAPPVIYGILADGMATNNPSSVSSVLSVGELALFFFLFADVIWTSQPDVRFASFALNRSRHKVWLGINMIFYDLAFFELIEIIFAVEIVSVAYFQHPTPYADPIQIAAVLSFVYFFSLIIRNSVCNLLGQGYGRFTPFPGKIAGTSIVGVASIAEVARSCFTRAELRGKKYLLSCTQILAETLSVRRIELDGLEDLSGALSFMGSFGTPVPYDGLAVLAEDFARLGSPLDSVQNLAMLRTRIRGFLQVIQWPKEFRIIPLRRWSENATLIATVIGAIVTAAGVAFEVLHISVLPNGIAIGIGVVGDLIAMILIAIMIWLSYGPFTRLGAATVSLGDLRRL